MSKIKIYNSFDKPDSLEKKELIDFLFEQLEEYGDPRGDIEKAINYAIKETVSFGGFVLASYEKEKLVGAVVVNQTGMQDYIPENILVYIATHKEFRGKGIGKELMQKAIELAKGKYSLACRAGKSSKISL